MLACAASAAVSAFLLGPQLDAGLVIDDDGGHLLAILDVQVLLSTAILQEVLNVPFCGLVMSVMSVAVLPPNK